LASETLQRRRDDVSRSLPLLSRKLTLNQVVRTRTLLVRIEDWERVAVVHGEFFGEIRPANTIMQVSRFIDPDWLVEFEADAVVDSGSIQTR
jgi:enamine deaminase RidA (YjgF/YER057c/UK114 family)